MFSDLGFARNSKHEVNIRGWSRSRLEVWKRFSLSQEQRLKCSENGKSHINKRQQP